MIDRVDVRVPVVMFVILSLYIVTQLRYQKLAPSVLLWQEAAVEVAARYLCIYFEGCLYACMYACITRARISLTRGGRPPFLADIVSVRIVAVHSTAVHSVLRLVLLLLVLVLLL